MTESSEGQRGSFGSRLGFVFAAAGSAIGLGNIWRFPYVAGESGGGAFVFIYLLFVALIGVPVLLCEVSMGRASQRNPVGAFKRLVPPSAWTAVGALGVIAGFVILSFYSVVAGWTLGYIYKALMGAFSGGVGLEESTGIFNELKASPGRVIALTAAFLVLTVLVVRGGVSGGIERAAKVLMPLFLVLLIILCIRSVTLEGAGGGIDFLLAADFSKLTPNVVVEALGQALFSLSLGMGAMITYGSYLPKEENLPVASVTVAGFDTLIALLSGFLIFPALFAAGADPQAGPQLVFVVVPTILDALPAGGVFGFAFYFLLAIAALTSSISLLEVVTAYFVDELGWSRERSVWTVTLGCFALAIPTALSFGAVPGLTTLIGSGEGAMNFFGLQNLVFGTLALSVGALFICLFVGWKWGVPAALGEIERIGHLPGTRLWGVLVRFVCPVAVALVLGWQIYSNLFA